MAADMRARAQGRWVDDAITSMLHSNQEAGRVLRAHDASACTDITGFGLVGHILEMLAGSGLGATLNLDQLPVLQGAIESIAAGIVSSLQPKNERFVRRLEIAETVQSDPRLPLLYDPQTAGGLLAGVPRERVDACIADLREQGYAATAIVGEVHPVENSARPVRVVSS
jgi:selenide,water dikinase